MEFSLNDPDQFFSAVASSFASPKKKVGEVDVGCIVEQCSSSATFSCPSCNQHYCSRHAGSTLMVAKLNSKGEFDSTRGEYQRICVYCYWESRPGYRQDDLELEPKCHTEEFNKMRSLNIDKLELSMARIEKRLEKLSEYSQFSDGIGRVSFDEYCQRLIQWEEDDASDSCRLCSYTFSLLNRRHHCRLCGKLICEGCSSSLPVRVLNEQSSAVIMTRACSRCFNLLFKYSIYIVIYIGKGTLGLLPEPLWCPCSQSISI